MSSVAGPRVLVIMPAHDEEASIGETIRRIRENLPAVDIAVISDFSSDRTTEVAERHGARVIELPNNLGYGGAIQTGFKVALARGYDVVLQMAADGQHSPEDARALLQPVLAGEADVSIGSRFLGRTTYKVPGLRRLGMRVFGMIVTFVTRRRFSDPTSGYQAMNRRAMEFF
ncbi:MAG: glycosyltransferase family 2 protein, partial [Candidatus Eisenbacteria bacterium]